MNYYKALLSFWGQDSTVSYKSNMNHNVSFFASRRIVYNIIMKWRKTFAMTQTSIYDIFHCIYINVFFWNLMIKSRSSKASSLRVESFHGTQSPRSNIALLAFCIKHSIVGEYTFNVLRMTLTRFLIFNKR